MARRRVPTTVTRGPGSTSTSEVERAERTAIDTTPAYNTARATTTGVSHRSCRTGYHSSVTAAANSGTTRGHRRIAHPTAPDGEKPSRSTSEKISKLLRRRAPERNQGRNVPITATPAPPVATTRPMNIRCTAAA